MLLLPLWVLFGFVVSQLLLVVIVKALSGFGVVLTAMNASLFNTVTAACVYVLTLLFVIGVPWWVRNYGTTWSDIGLTRLPSWMDMGLAPAGFVVYLLFSAFLMYGVTQLVPGFDPNEVQELGFTHLTQYFEYLLAFITLVIVAPVAEEVLFRGYLYGKLRRSAPIWLAMLITSALFGFIHGKWNVAIDVFALSVVMCSLREITGSIWAGILLHIMKNGLAFYIVFINPSILHTIG